uniref:4-hydroxy-7-methoxy-3-oxo-3,4-dihydro-2H-1,4-benzoxazin-2-yl glucosidebeta-D-glucosidase n=1 Tax=Oryza meridionalis TaxID=40149 RepID=A0A0E0CX45_9ORYZ
MGRIKSSSSGQRSTARLQAVAVLVVVFGVASSSLRGCIAQQRGGLTRGSFPEGFVFGTASAAYQITDFSNADVAVDQYHRFEEDIQLMADMGMDAYRFSIAWSRIYPNGVGQVNQAGIDHYNKLIDALLAKGIQPYATLYHWDLPQALEDKYRGWLDKQIVDDFAAYAETCFREFGDRVKHWITLNEPHTVAIQGYDAGLQAPGRCSVLLHLYCKAGNSGTEPYVVAHHFILAHAAAASIYRTKYKATQNGQLGIAFDVMWFEPMSNTTIDIEAAKRAQEFADPFFFGDYPATMRARVGERLPRFTADEAAVVKGALDFVGINHYTTYYTRHNNTNIIGTLLNNTLADTGTVSLPFKNGKPIGDRANSIWLYIVPRGMRSLMNYVKERYNRPPVYITENGMDDSNNPFISIKDALKDSKRIKYHNDYLTNLAASIKEDGCDVRGYFAWSLLDNWEWAAGYSSRFGLYFVDYKDNLKRYPKNSVQWFKALLNSS